MTATNTPADNIPADTLGCSEIRKLNGVWHRCVNDVVGQQGAHLHWMRRLPDVADPTR